MSMHNRVIVAASVALFSCIPAMVQADTGRALASKETAPTEATREHQVPGSTSPTTPEHASTGKATPSYAEREKAANNLAEFRGGDPEVYIGIGGSAVALALIIVLIVVLF